MEDRDWSGPLGHSNWHSRVQLEGYPRWKTLLGIFTVVAMLISIGNELITIDLNAIGLATVIRPLHALLGLAGILWVLFNVRIAFIALLLWIVMAIPVLGFDASGVWVRPLFPLNITHTLEPYGYEGGGKTLQAFRSYGVNLAPLLVGAWFFVLSKINVFPVVRRRIF